MRHSPHVDALLRVLVVDDYPDNADSMAMLLRLDGYDVDVAWDGEEAIDVAHNTRPHVVLCDLSMPRMAGFEVAKRMRRMFGSKILLIAISAQADDENHQSSFAAGFNLHLMKPADPVQVQKILRGFAREIQESGPA